MAPHERGTMTLDEAHLELLDHIGEEVAVGIAPGGMPFAGGEAPSATRRSNLWS
jgi:hypothetical protein